MSVSLYELSQRINSAIPVGTIVAYYGTTAPTGWLICDGRSCAGTELAKMIGNNVPDLRGRFLRMIGGNAAGMGIAQGESIGPHNHSIQVYWGDGWSDDHENNQTVSTRGAGCYSGQTAYTNSAGSGENRPINMAFNFIIKANLYYRLVFLSHLNNMFRGEGNGYFYE